MAAGTRDAIVDAALTLFSERGYARTTMRAVAERAGVSVGNAYYYFGSKDQLVQGFYDQMIAGQVAAAAPVLAEPGPLGRRLAGTVDAWVTVAEPYRELAGRFFAVAAQPDNPLSPFSAESSPARDAAIALYTSVADGSTTPVDDVLAAELPELMWLYHLGIVLFWVHDGSPGAARTRLLVERTAPMVERLARLSRLPIARPLSRQVAELLPLLRST